MIPFDPTALVDGAIWLGVVAVLVVGGAALEWLARRYVDGER